MLHTGAPLAPFSLHTFCTHPSLPPRFFPLRFAPPGGQPNSRSLNPLLGLVGEEPRHAPRQRESIDERYLLLRQVRIDAPQKLDSVFLRDLAPG